MNVNPKAKRILCFGDSNTYGETEGAQDRIPTDQRWTGVLQKMLGNDFEVIEEGRSGRTTNLEDPEKPGRNGAEYLFPCLKSHVPLDYVILMLGGNDFKPKFKRSAQDVAEATTELLATIQDTTDAKIVLIAPTIITFKGSKLDSYFPGMFNEHSEVSSKLLPNLLKQIANDNDYLYLDVNSVANTNDGIHIDLPSHTKLGQAIANIIT